MYKFTRFLLIFFFSVIFVISFDNYIDYKFKVLTSKSQETGITMKERERQLLCLTKNIYYEAGNESFEGKVAVAQVTLNRAESENFPNDICKVVYQKNSVLCQFSWWCETNTKIRPIHAGTYKESEAVAKKVLLEGFRLESLNEALFYHADYVNPKWKKQRITKIGRHIFYKG